MNKIYLRDKNKELVTCWQNYFKDYSDVEISCGDIFEIKADAIVSPANSFGYMDGGIDLLYRNRFGIEIETKLKADIHDYWHGELPVGTAITVELNDENYGFMISAPTMRTPGPVYNSINAYLAFRAAISTVITQDFKSILCPGLCTLTGMMPPHEAARQMYAAYKSMLPFLIRDLT